MIRLKMIGRSQEFHLASEVLQIYNILFHIKYHLYMIYIIYDIFMLALNCLQYIVPENNF